ncbi:uncharacterized protein LAESUDRAFT_667593 [Laetiporus sulphureus 93-53]|uniref:Ubiquitin 3 binding protein But2 C-terminal domain-containing protein n=1 Tax=Laetiporus sulphureus 93-53 TaxID=1314785 RepID=A0A165AVP4_9APHY|nr:uncharacterized protein LAESUDRAFT_667593 [Laetiporus sulphureus 93-53]KZS99755.1 hypothetical protein LAESUDRAFT_667593 [Laetiporus sulphureus 93-53]
MFAYALSLATALLAGTSLALPILQSRWNTSASCVGLPDGSTASPSYNFTLTAYNLMQSNANDNSVPLVLAWGPPGTSPAASEWVISMLSWTYESWGSNEWPYFTLTGGGLYPRPGSSENGLGACDFAINEGDEVHFIISIAESNPAVDEIYCAAVTVLAVNNDADNFSLCLAGTQNNLVYAPSTNNTLYTYDSCYPVRVYLLPYEG